MNGEHPLVLDWEQAFAAGPQVAGGKGWNLARLVRYGFKVPQGVVLVASAYELFLDHSGLREQIRAAADRLSAEEVATATGGEQLAELRRRITTCSMPPELTAAIGEALQQCGLIHSALAIRSSATLEDGQTASFAGIHDSFLNQHGLDAILIAIKGCYASLWSERAVAYRRKMKISDHDLAPAVVLMEMVAACSAGVGFSCDPASGRLDRMVLAANFGLGESVVSGAVEPDQYLLSSDNFNGDPRLNETSIGAKQLYTQRQYSGGTTLTTAGDGVGVQQVLSEPEIIRLARLTRQVFLTLGNGEQQQDIEWAFDGSDFWLLQARPVTALPRLTYPALKDQADLWSNANFRDAAPMVQTPFNWSFSNLLIDRIFAAQYQAAGYRIAPFITRFRLFKGRLYFNLTALQWECYDAFGLQPEVYNRLIGGHQSEISLPDAEPARLKLQRLIRNLRMLRQLSKVRNNAATTFHSYIRSIDQLRRRELQKLDDNGILKLLQEVDTLRQAAEPILLMLGSSGAVFGLLQPLLERFLPGRGQALITALLVGQQGITSADHGIRLLELAKLAERDADARVFFGEIPFESQRWSQLPIRSSFRREFKRFLEEYGHRGVYELDFSNPRWYEDPSWLLLTIRDMIGSADPDAVRLKQRKVSERAWQEVQDKLSRPLQGLVRRLVTMGGSDAANREMAKSVLVRQSDIYRRIALELGQRFVAQGLIRQQGDIFFCYWSELLELLSGQWDGLGLERRIEDRREQYLIWERQSPPDVVIDEQPHHVVCPVATGDNRLSGLGVAAGQASGIARLIRHPDEGCRLAQGEVLVAPSTDPAWTPLFLKASALVAETGGFISHGAIVAREYGLPAVVNVAGALHLITDGQTLTVDGDHGTVGLVP